ncbi:MAG: hypothetical protein HQ519_05645 [Planctomycetes bacterium]|nr:hypothetical protein [Planctomycetota bacterium]
MSWRKLLFWVLFLAVPFGFIKWGVVPLKERRSEAVVLQQNAEKQAMMNTRMSQERDQLEVLWEEFRPQADLELISLGTNLNPILLQNRVLDLARRLGVELTIHNRTSNDEGALPTYSFSGSASPWQAHEFLRYLERGDHRARFRSVTLVYNKVKQTGKQMAYFSGEFSIPEVPDAPETAPPVDELNTEDIG